MAAKEISVRSHAHLAVEQLAVEHLAGRRGPESLANLIERCLDADYQIDRMGSIPLVVEAWADDLARV